MRGAPAVSRPNWQWKKASAAGVSADAQVFVQTPPGPRFPQRRIEYGPSRRRGQAQSTRANASDERIGTERLSCVATFDGSSAADNVKPNAAPEAKQGKRLPTTSFGAANGSALCDAAKKMGRDVKSKVETVIQPLPRKFRFVKALEAHPDGVGDFSFEGPGAGLSGSDHRIRTPRNLAGPIRRLARLRCSRWTRRPLARCPQSANQRAPGYRTRWTCRAPERRLRAQAVSQTIEKADTDHRGAPAE